MKSISFYILLFSTLACTKLDVGRINKLKTTESSLNKTKLISSSQIIDIGGSGMEYFGHCWSKNALPTISNLKTEYTNPYRGAEFNSILTQIEYNTTYYVRPYISSTLNTFYGEEDTVIITDISSVSSTINNTTINSETSVVIDGSFSSINSLKAIDCGICWSNNNSPTIDDNFKSLGVLISDYNFTDTLNNLIQETNYFLRIYAKFDNNTIVYSNEVNVNIDNLSVITGSYAQNGSNVTIIGDIVNLGVLPITDHGHCWSYSTSNPTINNNLISKGPTSSTGQFFNTINLISGNPITYYYRAYAIKENTIVYGDIETFTL